ncbi:MAG: cell division FtsZ family protein [Verrucomicrobiae bacterium]|nr:cell division FtsZ family protein [Verrucomicrobiae bacterium]
MSRQEKARGSRMKMIGVGDAGGQVVEHILRAGWLPGVEGVVFNTDAVGLGRMQLGERLALGRSLTRGLGTGGDMELGRRAAVHDADEVKAVVADVALVFLMVGLGGGTGGGAGPEIARMARDCGAMVLGMATLPFSFEGERRRQQAAQQLEMLRQHADAVVVIPNDKLLKLVGDDATALEAFRKCDEVMAIGARAVWQLLARPALIHLDFAALRNALGGQHGEGVVVFGEATGADRATQAVEALLANPLMENGQILGRSERVLVSVCGGKDLTLGEVQKCASAVKRIAPRAQIELGAAVDEDYGKKLSVTIVASTAVPARKPTPVPVPVAVTTGEAQPTVRPAERSAAGTVPGAAAREVSAKSRPKQGELPLEKRSSGRFENSEPTLWEGENLDVPTYVRKGVALTG